ncbi:hypothetical protein D8B26_005782 [Coccidioides posadasii str. Silveira]|uniref:Autophagy-related protein 101 n=1 Tax=Coccidioides posadasii (strain C735) TaxID=222929 RepID=C5P731_COCP7|nr:hypothetical protein CPC735_025670 [Coccidioides posadasii C735 delta SOWgp]EER27231.1 hypothetical protein CPC735_025670 [Coccidioides posadasii C735 delta SOWgp]QVM11131.1 hypothetical protein D8B26_005782 [Coccidioides posadasii str. Silveira]|eukprot:XP_003069376.1 hypothetical protein CPC735_025670 [Coccidioides posadasii C735 delta SOWgp]
MDPRKPPEHVIDVFADPASVKDVLKGILHTIFFHRYFPCVRPDTFDVLDLTLPAVDDVEVETLIDSRINTLIRQHLSPASNSPNGGVRGRIGVQFFEKKRRKGGLWFGALAGKNEEAVCWEIWTVDVTIATPRTESDRAKVRKAMEKTLQKAAFKILAIANQSKDHIPPITTSDANPFPFQIILNPKLDNWGNKLGFY